MTEMRLLGLALLLATSCACSTQRGYEGPVRDSSELALIQGDPKFRMVPVAAFLRSVDGRVLKDIQASTAVAPGEHELIVDCVVAESGDRQRIRLQVVVEAGRRYRLEPALTAANQTCETVRLMPSD